MDFPRYVFTEDGEEECKLGTYGSEIVEDKTEFAAAIKAGYKENVTDLFDKPVEKKFAKKPDFKKTEDKKLDEDDF